MFSRSALLLTILLGSLTAGCTHLAEPRDKTATKAPKLSKERQGLSEGYSILYQDARKFDASDLVPFRSAVEAGLADHVGLPSVVTKHYVGVAR